MTKSDLVTRVAELTKLSQSEAEVAVGVFFDAMTNGLQDSNRVELRGFGSFAIREYQGYLGRNPRTGETVNVPPKRLPFFKVGKELRIAVNKKEV